MRSKGGLAAALIVLCVAATPAYGTATRAEYSAAVNPICRTANAQVDQVIALVEAKLKRIERRQKRRGDGGNSITITSSARDLKAKRGKRKRSTPVDAFDRIFQQAYEQIEQIKRAELAQLQLVAPAPGDESLVASWLANRQLIFDLSEQGAELEEKSAKLFDSFPKVGKHPTLKSFTKAEKKLDRRIRRFDRQVARIYDQIEAAYKVDLEYGTQLGASYCVTQATGTFSAR